MAKAKKSPEWKSLPDDKKAEYLLTHLTLSDRTWTGKPRLKGEKRDAFSRRVLLGEVADGEATDRTRARTPTRPNVCRKAGPYGGARDGLTRRVVRRLPFSVTARRPP